MADDLVAKTSQIVTAYLSNPNHAIAPGQIPEVIAVVSKALVNCIRLRGDDDSVDLLAEPAVPIRKSIFPDYLVCLEDGREMKLLKRYLRVKYNLTPEQYRKRWNLPPDYPMVAPNYAQRRSDLAMSIGLGKVSGRSRGKTEES